jgi:hypothetical protein
VTIAEPEPDTIHIVEVCTPDRMGEVAAWRSDRLSGINTSDSLLDHLPHITSG